MTSKIFFFPTSPPNPEKHAEIWTSYTAQTEIGISTKFSG